MLHYIEQGTLKPLSTVAGNVLYFRVPFASKIKRVDVFCAASNISGDAVFDVNIGPSPGSVISIFTDPAQRVRITTGQLTGAVTGLNVTVGAGYIGTLDLDSVPPGGVSAPFFLVVTVDDELSAGVSAEDVQDIVGAMLTDSTELDFSYDDGAGTETATLKTTGVAAGTYGTATKSARVTVDGKGRITSAAEIDITGGGSGGGISALTGDVTAAGDGVTTIEKLQARALLLPGTSPYLADNFNDNSFDTTVWFRSSSADVLEQNSRIEIRNSEYLESRSAFNLTGKYLKFKAQTGIWFKLFWDTNNRIEIRLSDAGYLRLLKFTGGVQTRYADDVAYNATTDLWAKIEHSSVDGLIHLSTSPDNVTWTERASGAPPQALSAGTTARWHNIDQASALTWIDDVSSNVTLPDPLENGATIRWNASANRFDTSSVVPWAALPTMQNGWVNYASGYQVAQYRKIGDRVEVRGFIKNGSINDVICAMPAALWPPASLQFPAYTAGGLAAIDISGGDGMMRVFGGTNGYVGLAFSYSVTA